MKKRKSVDERYFARCKRTKFSGTSRYLFDVPLRLVYNGSRVYCRLISDPESEFYYAEYYGKTGAREDIHIIEHSITFDIGNEIGWIHKNLKQPFFEWLKKTLDETNSGDKKLITYNDKQDNAESD